MATVGVKGLGCCQNYHLAVECCSRHSTRRGVGLQGVNLTASVTSHETQSTQGLCAITDLAHSLRYLI